MRAKAAAPCWRSGGPSSRESEPPSVTFAGAAAAGLLRVFHLGAIGLVVADEERLERRRDVRPVEVALLVRLHLGRALPQAHRKARVLVLPVLEQPAPAQTLDLPSFGGHRGAIRLLELVPRAGPKLSPGDPHDHGRSSFWRLSPCARAPRRRGARLFQLSFVRLCTPRRGVEHPRSSWTVAATSRRLSLRPSHAALGKFAASPQAFGLSATRMATGYA